MQSPKVTETSRLSAHRRQVALVRWSLAAVPPDPDPTGLPNRDAVRWMERGHPRATRFATDW